MPGVVEDVFVEAFFVEDDVWFDDATAFGAVWDLICAHDWGYLVVGEAGVAFCAMVYQWATVDIVDVFAAGTLVEHVYVLGVEGFQVAFFF